MRNLLIIFFLIPTITYSQLMITTHFFERTDTKKEINTILDFSIGSFVTDDILLGITNEDAVSDYISEGSNPIQDSLIISNFQFFMRYYYNPKSFFLIKMPANSDVIDISIFDRVRVGGGYIFNSKDNLDFDISYDVLLGSNLNGWNKGRLTINLSKSINTRSLRNNLDQNLFRALIEWINIPLEYGYRESMFFSKSN